MKLVVGLGKLLYFGDVITYLYHATITTEHPEEIESDRPVYRGINLFRLA
jgi:hypothetical protein